MRTRPGPCVLDGVEEGQALGKWRGLREDRHLRVRATQSRVLGGAKETARAAGGALRRRRGLQVGAGHAAGHFSLLVFFSGPMRRRTSPARASWAVGLGGGTA